jgi:CO/xanthine dehydrogenase Mo-binding subunit
VCGAFRGFGATQACLALEGQMSELARQLEIDEIEFRIQNLLTQGDISGFGHEILLPLGVPEALQAAAHHPLWRNQRRLSETNGQVRRGVGVAVSMKGFGLGANDAQDYSAAEITLKTDGRFLLRTGIVELGQGSFTAMVQIAAEELGCSPDLFDFSSADTLLDPDAGTTAASRVTYSVGRVVIAAAHELAGRIKQLACRLWEVPESQVKIADGQIIDLASTQTFSLAQIAQLSPETLHVSIKQRIPYSELLTKGGLAHPHLLYSSHVQLVQLAVDMETCEVNVERVVCFPEVGKVINRLGLEGQCEGGVAQGIGYALMEQVAIDNGRIINDDLTRYSIPTAADVPQIEVIPIEVPEFTGPFGAKGAAENATIPTAPAILDALAKAISVRFTSIPVTPERIFQVLSEKSSLQKDDVE